MEDNSLDRLAEAFYNTAIKRQQWKAFLNKGRFAVREEEFGAVCRSIKLFVMPVIVPDT